MSAPSLSRIYFSLVCLLSVTGFGIFLNCIFMWPTVVNKLYFISQGDQQLPPGPRLGLRHGWQSFRYKTIQIYSPYRKPSRLTFQTSKTNQINFSD
jgi:hypothetical protein